MKLNMSMATCGPRTGIRFGSRLSASPILFLTLKADYPISGPSGLFPMDTGKVCYRRHVGKSRQSATGPVVAGFISLADCYPE